MTKHGKQQNTVPRIETYLDILKQDELLYRTAQQCITELDEPEDQMYVTAERPRDEEFPKRTIRYSDRYGCERGDRKSVV